MSRLSTFPICETNKRKEYDTIKQILHNNKYDVKILEKITPTSDTQTQERKEKTKTKWAKFTYVGRQTKFITKLFKNTKLKISFKTENTIGKMLTQNNKNTNFNKFSKSGVYQLTCQDCNKKYIGQTGRPFYARFQEHFRDFKYGNVKSKFAHLLDNRHSIGPMENTMEVLHINKKGNMMNTQEKFHIYNVTRLDSQINDKVQ